MNPVTLVVCALLAGIYYCPAQVPQTGAGLGTPLAPVYTGPGDIVSGAKAFWSCTYSYSSAYKGPLCNVCLPADAACADITQSAGVAVIPAGLATCNNSSVLCTVKTAYDQSGALNCGSAACDITNATGANRPTFVVALAANGCPAVTLPCIKNNGKSLVNSTGMTQANPLTLTMVESRTGNTTSNSTVLTGTGNNVPFWGFINSTNTLQLFNGGSGTCTATGSDNAFHASIGVLNGNGASSSIYVDGSNTACTGTTPGTSGFGSGKVSFGQDGLGTTPCACTIGEVGVWPSAFNGTQAANMNTNMKTTRWGF